MLIHYLAKVPNESFMKQVEFASALWQKKKPKQSVRSAEHLIMYDGGNRENPDHVQWNLYYKELLEYKEMHGHCCVPSVRNKNARVPRKEHERLARFVSSQRTLDKQDKDPPKRRELLEDIGFVWGANANSLKLTDNTHWHKALAAKLFFKTITAQP